MGVLLRVKNRLIGVCLVLLLMAGVCAAPLFAADTTYADGYVLFASRYRDYTSLRETGLDFGTASWPEADAKLAVGFLQIHSSSDQKTYLLLPAEIPGTDTYTIVYEFRFSDVSEPGGYCGFILTSSGDAPSNRTELILRANGSCDGAGSFRDEIAEAMQNGKIVRVTVPIRHGMLSEVRVSVNGLEETLEMANVRNVPAGRRGFVFRNASVDLQSVKVVAGVEYKTETGYYAKYSYEAPVTSPDPEMEDVVAPPTGGMTVWPVVAAVAVVGIVLLKKRRYA